MNLITDAWIPIVRLDGTREKIAPWQIADNADNPPIEFIAPRPDFQGALYQFLIGLLQTTFAPEDADEWLEYWNHAPLIEDLKRIFSGFEQGFELENPEGIAFLQDYDMPDGEVKDIAALLIDAPGENTLKKNLDHFVKGGLTKGMCCSCVATALFTLQTNAPAGGSGHLVGVRGGGPLTTLIVPQSKITTLWQKLWPNVMSEEAFKPKIENLQPDVFPWLALTRLSGKKGKSTLPIDTHPFQAYWGMPRRIRIEAANKAGFCNVCGEKGTHLYTHFRTKTYGVDYTGPWHHPLTPYRFEAKLENPLSLKGQQGGLGYRHWLGLVWTDSNNGDTAALCVQSFHHEKSRLFNFNEAVGLWAFGYDMDKMKARCWYEQRLPVIAISEGYRDLFLVLVANLIDAAKDVAKELRSQIKAAWFSRPKDVKGDLSMIDNSFWEATETVFYQQLEILARLPDDTRHMPVQVAKNWIDTLRKHAFELFDTWVLEGNTEDMDMRRITAARRFLKINLSKIKTLKNLQQLANAEPEVAQP